jgi:hypothetical protein
MTDLDAFLAQAWADHADRATEVAARLPAALPWVQDDDGVMRLAGLAHHVLGEHLGLWMEGRAFLERLSELGLHGAGAAASIARCQSSLRLCGGSADTGTTEMNVSDRCRVASMAAANLARRDAVRGAKFLDDAVALADVLLDTDPGVRVLAANGNNMAATLQELGSRDLPQRALMIRAAQVARVQWERAGTWLEVERAEYRLAVCWMAAGEPVQALQHAQRCDGMVRANGSRPLELFFAGQALCLAARALGQSATGAQALDVARQAFAALTLDDQAWCRATLDQLNAG